MAAPFYVDTGASDEAASGGSLSPAWPTHLVDDIAICFVETAGGETPTLDTANGFVPATSLYGPSSPGISTGSGSAGTRISVYWCRATSTSMAAPVFTAPSDHAFAVILTFRGCEAGGNPIENASNNGKFSASTSASAPSITTRGSERLVINAISRDNDSAAAAFSSWANANLTGFGEVFDGGTALGNGGGIGIAAGEKATAGSVGVTTATVTSSINAMTTFSLLPELSPSYSISPSSSASSSESSSASMSASPSDGANWQGEFPPGSVVNDATIGDTAWQDPSYALSQTPEFDYSRIFIVDGHVSNYLLATDFGFSLPPTATITDITVTVYRWASDGGSGFSITDNEIRLFLDGSPIGTGKSNATPWNTNEELLPFEYGGDVWGATLTPDDVNDSTFGVGVSVKNDGFDSDEAYVDYIEMVIFYDEGSPSSSLSPSSSESASQSPSASISPSSSESSSASASVSPSSSESSSVSSSVSPSISPSPSEGYEEYSRGVLVSLPTDDADLATAYITQDYLDVDADDGVRVGQVGQTGYIVHQFKDFVGALNSCTLRWNGRTNLAPSDSTAYLQIYDRNLGSWETVDSDSSSGADNDFNLTASIPDLTDYKSAGNVISCRVYQQCL